jgi:hypothetical protein
VTDVEAATDLAQGLVLVAAPDRFENTVTGATFPLAGSVSGEDCSYHFIPLLLRLNNDEVRLPLAVHPHNHAGCLSEHAHGENVLRVGADHGNRLPGRLNLAVERELAFRIVDQRADSDGRLSVLSIIGAIQNLCA